MSFNLLDAVKGYFNSDMISKAASFLGENESGVSKAIGGILPSVLHGIASKAGTSSGAEEVASMAKEHHGSGLLGNLGDIFSNGGLLAKGADMLKGLFGAKAGGIIDTIAGFAGIKSSSASSLMSVAAPVALGAIGKHAAENNLGASGISSLLSGAKSMLAGLLPSGMGSLLGIGGTETATAAASHSASHSAASDDDHTGGGVKWLTPLLLLAVLGFLAWWLLNSKSCGKSVPAGGHSGGDTSQHHTGGDTSKHSGAGTMNMDMPKITIDSTGLVMYELGKEMEFDLGNGVKIMAAENGFEAQMLKFIKSGKNDTIDKKANWFNMFDVQFKTGGNTYTGKAEAMLKNCAAILQAFPNVKIKLGGYTDNSGAAGVNKRISQQRADKVKADLVKMGAAAGQIAEAMGYGPEHPVCEANDTPECKARNRRVACKPILP